MRNKFKIIVNNCNFFNKITTIWQNKINYRNLLYKIKMNVLFLLYQYFFIKIISAIFIYFIKKRIKIAFIRKLRRSWSAILTTNGKIKFRSRENSKHKIYYRK